jgi:2-polyprenyl-3-methyl-5-hydroxy-6-metoxy-1,4-benzoquinol methylase
MTDVDMERLQAFAGHVTGQIIGAVTTAMVVLGDELGLYRALAQSGPVTPATLAEATNTHERYVREWLLQQASIGFIRYDAESGTFALPAEHAAVLATDDSPAALAGAALMPAGLFRSIDKLAHAFRTGNGVPWGDQDEAIFSSAERFFGASYRHSLVNEWIPALGGVEDKLVAGAQVADVGTGRGVPLLIMADAFPVSRFVGYDDHEPSIEVAAQRATKAGVADRVRFEVAGAANYAGKGYDLICFFDTLHDLGDPVSAAVHARHALAPGGTLMLVEPLAFDDVATNLANNPGAAMHYGASTFLCVANSLSQPVGLSLGAQAGEARLRAVLTEAGFRHVRRVAENPINMVLEARP